MPFTLVSGSFCLHFSGSTLIFCFRANHLPTKRRVAIVVPNFDEELKVFKCISPLCKVTSKKWFNIVWHIKRCPKIVDCKKEVKKNRTCRHCRATFVHKSNCDHHIRNNTLTKMKPHTRMEMMIWLLMTLKWFQHKLLIWIPWWNSVWKFSGDIGRFWRTGRTNWPTSRG